MQRRAGAIYAAFFIVLAAGAYGTIGVAQEPTVTIQNPDYSLTEGETVMISDREYRAADFNEASAQLVWVEADAEFTVTWENGSTVTLDGTDFTVRTDVSTDPPSATLTEVQELDENVTTTEIDGETFVVVHADGERRLVPRADYLRDQQGPPEVREFDEGDRVDYQGNRTVASSITNDSVTLTWTGPRNNSVDVQHASVVTLGGQEFIAHFPDASTLELSADIDGYRSQEATIDTYHERISGLWGVTIVSGLAALLVIGLAYLPSRY